MTTIAANQLPLSIVHGASRTSSGHSGLITFTSTAPMNAVPVIRTSGASGDLVLSTSRATSKLPITGSTSHSITATVPRRFGTSSSATTTGCTPGGLMGGSKLEEVTDKGVSSNSPDASPPPGTILPSGCGESGTYGATVWISTRDACVGVR
jgi:hypothetical protein